MVCIDPEADVADVALLHAILMDNTQLDNILIIELKTNHDFWQ